MSICYAVIADDVSKTYAATRALQNVGLGVPFGCVHGLLGPNGAGKTTLLRVLLGLAAADSGEVQLLGCQRPRLGGPLPDGVAGFVDTPAFYPYLTGRQNLQLLARLDGRRANSGQGLDGVLAALELNRHADRTVAGYSTGVRQRLALAAALIRTPQLLLLDEPTSSLDPGAARVVRDLIAQLAEQGTAVVISSHDLDEVEALCASITVMKLGQVVFDGPIERLKARAPGASFFLRTANDVMARTVALHHANRPGRSGFRVEPGVDGFAVVAQQADMDAFVTALGGEGIAIRELTPRGRSLEALFSSLIDGPAPLVPPTAIVAASAHVPVSASAPAASVSA